MFFHSFALSIFLFELFGHFHRANKSQVVKFHILHPRGFREAYEKRITDLILFSFLHSCGPLIHDPSRSIFSWRGVSYLRMVFERHVENTKSSLIPLLSFSALFWAPHL